MDLVWTDRLLHDECLAWWSCWSFCLLTGHVVVDKMILVRICHVVVSLIVHDDHYGRYHDIDADDQHGNHESGAFVWNVSLQGVARSMFSRLTGRELWLMVIRRICKWAQSLIEPWQKKGRYPSTIGSKESAGITVLFWHPNPANPRKRGNSDLQITRCLTASVYAILVGYGNHSCAGERNPLFMAIIHLQIETKPFCVWSTIKQIKSNTQLFDHGTYWVGFLYIPFKKIFSISFYHNPISSLWSWLNPRRLKWKLPYILWH